MRVKYVEIKVFTLEWCGDLERGFHPRHSTEAQIDEQSVIISYHSDVKRGTIIGARLTGVSMFITAHLVGVSRTTVSRVMPVYTNLGKVSSEKHNIGRNSKMKNRDRWVLKRIVTRKHKTALL
ncbi:HTH_Tnp_Tc3_2 domain-containing protein [Trichonephila clavipes]|nr:HTH_Tnp_Tc3_2 domain-containing protein [Trichonephila clavipes]